MTQTRRLDPTAYLIYLLAGLPWLTEYLETGEWPGTVSDALTELGLTAAIILLAAAWLTARRGRRDLASEIGRMGSADPLTLLGNAIAMEETLVREIARSRRMDRPMSCLFLDLDDFKSINDRFGHNTGNGVLQAVGRTLRSVIRQNVDSAFRYGGDEFLLILPETDRAQALAVAERLRQSIAALRPPAIPLKRLDASLCIAQLRPDLRAMDLLGLMDQAIRRAKTRGKNLIVEAD